MEKTKTETLFEGLLIKKGGLDALRQLPEDKQVKLAAFLHGIKTASFLNPVLPLNIKPGEDYLLFCRDTWGEALAAATNASKGIAWDQLCSVFADATGNVLATTAQKVAENLGLVYATDAVWHIGFEIARETMEKAELALGISSISSAVTLAAAHAGYRAQYIVLSEPVLLRPTQPTKPVYKVLELTQKAEECANYTNKLWDLWKIGLGVITSKAGHIFAYCKDDSASQGLEIRR